MTSRSSRLLLTLALPFAAAVGACTEDLDTGSTCPLLCPGQEIVFLDTVLEPGYTFDTTLLGFPLQGLDGSLLLADRGDTIDVRSVVRFDTLVRLYQPTGVDSLEPITHIDSAFLSLRVRVGGIPIPERIVIEAYDVFDSTVTDSATTDLLPLFVVERLLGSVSFDSASFTDSTRVKIPIDSAMLRTILANPDRRLHIGLQVHGRGSSTEMLVTPYLPGGDGPALEYLISPDTAIARVTALHPSSNTPSKPGIVAGDLVDFQIVANAPNLLAPETFLVGGLPGARTYLRFDLPRWLTDSVGVIRARLELTQDPLYGASGTDTLYLVTHLVVAGHEMTDLRRAATLLTSGGLYAPTLKMLPSDSGVRSIEMNTLVRLWATADGVKPLPSAIVLRTDSEGQSPMAARFFSRMATDPSLRPRLRVSYTPGSVFGRP